LLENPEHQDLKALEPRRPPDSVPPGLSFVSHRLKEPLWIPHRRHLHVAARRNALMDAAYDDQVYVDDRTIDSHIKRLRKKFRE
jgi:hypothetical protein